jgi:hypothetical protein
MSKLTYAQKLLDPRWQRRRLEVLQAAGWKCQWCNDSNKTLHIHHLIYRRGVEPWDHEDGDLVALCEPCHREEGEKMEEIKDRLTEGVEREMVWLILKTANYNASEPFFGGKLGGLTSYLFRFLSDYTFAHKNPGNANEVARVEGSLDDVLKVLNEAMDRLRTSL